MFGILSDIISAHETRTRQNGMRTQHLSSVPPFRCTAMSERGKFDEGKQSGMRKVSPDLREVWRKEREIGWVERWMLLGKWQSRKCKCEIAASEDEKNR